VAKSVEKNNSLIVQPCYIGENVKLENSIIGPYASIGDNTVIKDSTIKNAIVQTSCKLSGSRINNAMIGNQVELKNCTGEMSIGDFSTLSN
jgi:glucose-1-phosphate thymidylyltransferase